MPICKHNLETGASDNWLATVRPLGRIISMAKKENALRIGAAIKTARKRRGLVQRNIAEALGIEVAAVGMWESGKNSPSFDNLRRAAALLKVDASALSEGELVYLDDSDLADAEVITDLAPLPVGPMDVQLLGVSYGGDDGDFSFNGEVQGFVRRPPGIASLKNVFALHVLSDSMVPRYDPGEVIYCGGREPVAGDHVVIEMFPAEEGQIGKAFIKKLVQRTSKEILVEQYNPKKQFGYDAYAIKRLWRVIPLKELLGF